MLEASQHIVWEKLGVLLGVFLVVESLLSMKYSTDQREWVKVGRGIRLIAGIISIYMDGFVFLKSFGVNILGG